MPFPNFHSARLQNPNLFADGSFRTKTTGLPDGVSLLIAHPKGRPGKSTQATAYHFSREKFTAAQAKAWLKEKAIKYQQFEPAAEASKLSRASAIQLERTLSFRKGTLRTGAFRAQDGNVLNVTPERLAEIEQSFRDMQADGIKIPIYGTTHTQALNDFHSEDPARVAENCLGYMSGAIHDGDQLDMLYDFADDEAVQIAKRVQQVSACIEPDFTSFIDGKEKKYSNAITHVLLTPEPAMPDQDEFAEAACFSRVPTADAAPAMLAQGADTSDDEVRKALGKAIDAEAACAVPQPVCPSNAWVVEVYPDYFVYHSVNKYYKRQYTIGTDGAVTLADAAEEVTEERTWAPVTAAQLSRNKGETEMELTELVKELGLPAEADETACKVEIAKLKARPAAPVQLHRESSDPLVEAAEAKLAGLVNSGIVTPAKAAKLQAAMIGTTEKPIAFALSRAVSGAEGKALAFAVLDILGEPGEAVAPGEVSGMQVPADAVMLQHPTGGAPEADKTRREGINAEMVAEANKA